MVEASISVFLAEEPSCNPCPKLGMGLAVWAIHEFGSQIAQIVDKNADHLPPCRETPVKIHPCQDDGDGVPQKLVDSEED